MCFQRLSANVGRIFCVWDLLRDLFGGEERSAFDESQLRTHGAEVSEEVGVLSFGAQRDDAGPGAGSEALDADDLEAPPPSPRL